MSDRATPTDAAVADEPWYRAVVSLVASWVGSWTLGATGLLSSGVLAAAIVVFYAWRRLGSRPVAANAPHGAVPRPS